MPYLTGSARFNGAGGEYSVTVDSNGFERELRIGPLSIWEAFDGEDFWQSNFGSPVYRRPAPFSIREAKQWHTIWQNVASGSPRREWKITSTLGDTKLQFVDGALIATTDVGNVTEYGPAQIQEASVASFRPIPPDRIDFSLPFDLSIGAPRAKIMIGDRPIQVMIDTGCDHSIFASSLSHEDLGLTVKVNAAGGLLDLALGRLLHVQIGGALLSEITPFFMSFDQMPGPLRFLRGIIGQDVLGRGAVTFDQRRGLIIGRRESLNRLQWPIDGPYTKAIVDGKEDWYRIDTGSPFTMHVLERNSEDFQRSTQHRGIGGIMRVKPRMIDTIELDHAIFSKVPAFTEYTTEVDPEVIGGNIGNALLKDIEIELDFANGLSRFGSL